MPASHLISNNSALSDDIGNKNFYFYDFDTKETHGSLIENVDIVYGIKEQARHREVAVDTLDNYCRVNDIVHIDHLKIDTESNDIKVLYGARQLIDAGKINVIQCEINEMCILSKTFLYDFYQALPQYNIYRILPDGNLFALKEYHASKEVFLYHNIIAIRKEVDIFSAS